MMEDDQSKIEKLKKELYSRKGTNRDAHILDLHRHNAPVEDKWEPSHEEVPKKPNFMDEVDSPDTSSILKKILIFALIFFVVSGAVASFVFFTGNNVISADKIEIDVVGPVMIAAGEPMTVDVNITNQNNSSIELADLVAEYPKGTKDVEDKALDFPRERITVGDIASGDTVRKTIKIVPFGENGANLTIDFDFVYRVPNSSGVFNKAFSYNFIIGSSPLTLSVDTLREVNSGQSFDFDVNVVSNSTEIIKNVILVATIPFGYQLEKSSPAPISGKYVWRLGDIESQGKRTVELSGKIFGEERQNRVFKFSVGVENDEKSGVIEAPLAGVSKDIAITKPFLGTELQIERTRDGDYVAVSGETLSLTVNYINNLSVPIENAEIIAYIKGNIIDKSKIDPSDGYYNSSENTITWTKFEADDLAQILPGESGSVDFEVSLLKAGDPGFDLLRNPEAVVEVSVKGKRLSESDVPEEIISTATRKIKISSNPSLRAGVVRTIGPIENMGAIPPKVGQVTEYSIIWTATNGSNNLENAEVSAVLPTYVTWTGVSSPASEKVTFDFNSRKVTWSLGKVSAGTSSNLFRQAAFQVSINPSLSQVGTAPTLVGASSFKATDTFTKSTVSSNVGELKTSMPTDPSYSDGLDRVVE